jgi:hypothetical protein
VNIDGFSKESGIGRVADNDFSAFDVGFINRLINGGGIGCYERQAYSECVMVIFVMGWIWLKWLINPPHPKSAIVASMLRSE